MTISLPTVAEIRVFTVAPAKWGQFATPV